MSRVSLSTVARRICEYGLANLLPHSTISDEDLDGVVSLSLVVPLLPPNDLGEALTPDCTLVPPEDPTLDPLEDRAEDTLTEDRTLEPLDDRAVGPEVPTLDLLVTGLMVDVLLGDFILEPVF